MKSVFSFLIVIAVVFAMSGCGETKHTTIGEGEPDGVLKRDVDTSKNIAGSMSDKTRSEEKDVYGN